MSLILFKSLFHRPSPLEVATAELREAQLQLLDANTGLEYAQGMVRYNEQRVKRLTAYIKEELE